VAVSAQSLRGEWADGVEEVGEQIEFFPNEEYVVARSGGVDRRILLEGVLDENDTTTDEEDEMMATRMMEEYFVEDGDGEFVDVVDHDYEFEPAADEMEMAEVDNSDYADVDIVGNLIEDDDEHEFYWDEDDEPINKDGSAPEPGTVTIEGNHLLGGDTEDDLYDQYERRTATCGNNMGEIKIILKTDMYAYETSWSLVNKSNGKTIAKGPPAGTNYADSRIYSGRWCVPVGQYRAVVRDRGQDGMCAGNPSIYGCGYFKAYLNGQIAGQITNDKSRWSAKQIEMNHAPISSRIDGTSTNQSGSGNWCNKVRSVMKVPQGTCTLPNGQRGHRARVVIKVDKYGKETSWVVKDQNGNVRMKMGAIVAANGQKVVEDCLPAGTYSLTVSDMDGICCKHGQGHYKLYIDGKETAGGGSFIGKDTRQFKCGYDWIGAMSERDCEWWFAHDYRRRDWHNRCYGNLYCNKSYRHLKYSQTLKAAAQKYANTLLGTCDSTGIKHDSTDQGENLAKNKGKGSWGRQYPAELVTKRFVDNEEFWPWNKNAHLTQALWYSTRYMGCAESKKITSDGSTCRFQVCRYAKAGNCLMGKYNAAQGKNWMKPMMMDDSPCGPTCPPGGCHN